MLRKAQESRWAGGTGASEGAGFGAVGVDP